MRAPAGRETIAAAESVAAGDVAAPAVAAPGGFAGSGAVRPGGVSSGLRASFRLAGRRTVLADAYCTSPLKIAKTFPVRAANGSVGAAVTVMDVSPGLMDGDAYALEWDVGDGCAAAATTQSYAKVHPCPRSGARMTTRISVGRGASFVYAPQPTMLYADASLAASLEVDLAGDAMLLLIDTLCAGRIHYAAGEAFRFRSYESDLLVRAQGRVAAAGRLRLEPSAQRLAAIGAFEGATHAGTMYGFGPFVGRSALEALRPAVEEAEASGGPGLRCGVSLAARYGLAATALGRSADQVHAALLAIGRAFAEYADAHAPISCARFAWHAER